MGKRPLIEIFVAYASLLLASNVPASVLVSDRVRFADSVCYHIGNPAFLFLFLSFFSDMRGFCRFSAGW